MRVAVIGCGYVGLTTGAVLAYLGHQVHGVEKDLSKLVLLKERRSPIHEHGLEELIRGLRNRFIFTDKSPEAVAEAEVIIIAVGTPQKQNGEAETTYVENAAREVASGLQPGRQYTLVVKSTVPIGSNRRVAQVVARALEQRGVNPIVHMASNPEFLREGFAVRDSLYPERIVVGADDSPAIETMRILYRPILEQTFEPPAALPRPDNYLPPPLITTDPTSAEMIKYASNAFLATKISFINEIAGLCDKVGADVTEVARGMGLDSRIGPRFLAAGLGWGGSCFPKDTAALLAVASEYNYSLPIVQAAREVNSRQRNIIVEKLQHSLQVLRGRTIGVLGLAFKPNTDDVRESPALDLVRVLHERGARVRAHDPVAMPSAKQALTDLDVDYVDNPYDVARGADAVVLATEWNEYRSLDMAELAAHMRNLVFVDARNIYPPEDICRAGFVYHGVGRSVRRT